MIELRPANIFDSDDLLAWRNDPLTLACSRSTAPVSQEAHNRWMQFNVVQGYPSHMVWMADGDVESVGVVRFDLDRNDVLTCEASLTVAPKYRGMGYARSILSEACSYLPEYTIKAEIKEDNAASRRIFERCGFVKDGKRDQFIKYRRGPAS